MTEKGYGPSPAAVDAAALALFKQGHIDTGETADSVLVAAHDPALGDDASVNRGEHRREVIREVVEFLRGDEVVPVSYSDSEDYGPETAADQIERKFGNGR